jgi:release factor H-coupled RctB family protein
VRRQLDTYCSLTLPIAHTGSRGLGASILRHYTRSDSNPYFTPNHPEFQVYIEQHDHAVLWAKANRDLLAHRIRQCIFGERDEPSNEGVDEDDKAPVEESTPSAQDPREQLAKILDVTHNSVTRCGYEIQREMIDVWLHRKGAAPTDRGFVPCPGSRGDFSWILQPLGNGQLNGTFVSLLSTSCHY